WQPAIRGKLLRDQLLNPVVEAPARFGTRGTQKVPDARWAAANSTLGGVSPFTRGDQALMMIQETRCPRCGIRRIGNLAAWGRFWINVRLQVSGNQRFNAADAVRPAEPAYPFQPAELVRLGRYRDAIRAGLYTDWPADDRTDLIGLTSTDAV